MRNIVLILAAMGLLGPTLRAEPPTQTPEPAKVRKRLAPFFKPLAAPPQKATPDKSVELGRMLFYDRRLSLKQDRSCQGCHDLTRHGANGPIITKARKDKTMHRDAPSVYHAMSLDYSFWDGRTQDAKDQLAQSLLGRHEMAMAKKQTVVERVRSIDGYAELFQKAFQDEADPIRFDRVVEALASFGRGLARPAPFDRFMSGDDKALSARQLAGAMLFDQLDCMACHTGTHVGGQMIQKLGILRPWPNQKDPGHAAVSGNEAHRMFFRVSPLRNVAETAPYFHDGSSRTLAGAIRRMAWYERGRNLDYDQTMAIKAFLESLSSPIPADYIRKPKLPGTPADTAP